MEELIGFVAVCSGLVAPMLTVSAVVAIYMQKPEQDCGLRQLVFFFALLSVAGLTVRAVTIDDGCWLTHTASLGVLIVAGVLRRPPEHSVESAERLFVA